MLSFACLSHLDYSWLGERKDYWLLFLGAVIGALVTVALAKHEFKKAELRELRLSRDALLERLLFNEDRAVQMLALFAEAKLQPDFNLDTTGIIIWLSRSSGILTPETIKAINWHRYQLDHINSKLALFQLYRATGASQTAETLRQSICEHLHEVHKGLEHLRGLLIQESNGKNLKKKSPAEEQGDTTSA